MPKLYNLSGAASVWPHYSTDNSAAVAFARFSLDADTQVQDLRTYWQPQAHFWLAVEQLLQFPQTGVCATVTSDTTTTTTTTSSEEEEEEFETNILKLDSFEVNIYSIFSQ